MDYCMKAENKEAIKEFFGEFVVQLLFYAVFLGLGGVGLAYMLIGWGALWLLLPFGFIVYLLINKLYSKVESKTNKH